MTQSLHQPKLPLGHNQIRPGERVFVIAPLVAKPRPKNAHRYGGIASGPTYVEADPIGLAGGINGYGYSTQNPISNADPLGLCPWCLAIPLFCSSGGCEALIAAAGLSGYMSTPSGQQAAANIVSAVASTAPNDPCQLFPNSPGCQPKKASKSDSHHICTNKNTTSTARGGPWTPRFKALFDKAGMSLDDPLNQVDLPDHYGPHPEDYHQAVFDYLNSQTQGLSGNEYRSALQQALRNLRKL